MDRVSEFLKVAEDVGFDKDDIPDLSKVIRWQQEYLSFEAVQPNLLYDRNFLINRSLTP